MIILPALAGIACAAPPSPPVRPESGPGGTATAHSRTKARSFGEGASAWWLIEPDDPPATRAPVVLFLHGWMALDPWVYGAWIDHIVRRGHTVVFPRYQSGILTPPGEFLPNVLTAVREYCRDNPDPDSDGPPRRWTVIGHSIGGLLAANFAAAAPAAGLPVPAAVVCFGSGRTARRTGGFGLPLSDLTPIDPHTLLLSVAGESDLVCGAEDARSIVREASRIPPGRRAFVLVRSDDRGRPALVASHFSPCSPLPQDPLPATSVTVGSAMLAAVAGNFDPMREFVRTDAGRAWLRAPDRPELAESFEPPDTGDWLLWWRIADIALEAAAGTGPADPDALDRRLRNIGRWSDGTPIRPPVIERPASASGKPGNRLAPERARRSGAHQSGRAIQSD